MKALYEKVRTANPRVKIPDARTIDHYSFKQLLSGEFKIKSVKRCKITKTSKDVKVGQELSEPSQDHIKTHTLVEKVLDECGIALHSLSSLKQETPSSACIHVS
jgi:hypothetical protein